MFKSRMLRLIQNKNGTILLNSKTKTLHLLPTSASMPPRHLGKAPNFHRNLAPGVERPFSEVVESDMLRFHDVSCSILWPYYDEQVVNGFSVLMAGFGVFNLHQSPRANVKLDLEREVELHDMNIIERTSAIYYTLF